MTLWYIEEYKVIFHLDVRCPANERCRCGSPIMLGSGIEGKET